MELKCYKTKRVKYGLLRMCVKDFGHEGDCEFRGEVPDIVLRFGGKTPTIEYDQAGDIADELNDDGGQYRYSTEQVKAAMWKYLEQHIDDLLENLNENFMDYLRDLSEREKERLLGEPERDLKEEQREEYGDMMCDRMRGA